MIVFVLYSFLESFESGKQQFYIFQYNDTRINGKMVSLTIFLKQNMQQAFS